MPQQHGDTVGWAHAQQMLQVLRSYEIGLEIPCKSMDREVLKKHWLGRWGVFWVFFFKAVILIRVLVWQFGDFFCMVDLNEVTAYKIHFRKPVFVLGMLGITSAVPVKWLASFW